MVEVGPSVRKNFHSQTEYNIIDNDNKLILIRYRCEILFFIWFLITLFIIFFVLAGPKSLSRGPARSYIYIQ